MNNLVHNEIFIKSQEHARVAAMLAGDVRELDRILHDDLIYGHTSGLTDTKSTYLAKIENGLVRYLNAETDIKTIRRYSNFALILVHIRMDAMLNEAARVLNSMVMETWLLEGDCWRMIAHHPTAVTFAVEHSDERSH